MANNTVDLSSEKLTQILLKLGCKQSHINASLQRSAETGESLPEIMRDFGFLSGEQVAQALALQTGLEYFPSEKLNETNFAPLVKEFSIETFEGFLPVAVDEDGTVVVAVSDISLINQAKNKYYEFETRIVVSSFQTVQQAFRQHYAKTEQEFDAALSDFLKEQAQNTAESESSGKMVRLFNCLLKHACYSGASDLYLYKSEEIGVVRLKVNGSGRIFRSIPLDAFNRILNKLVTEHCKQEELVREPQEAQIKINDETGKFKDIANRYSFRLELAMTRDNEKTAVVRILDRQSNTNDMDRLGFAPDDYKLLKECIAKPDGLIVVTGPTGSGKTSSLYAMLKAIDPVERSIQSIENPIEFRHGLWMQYELPKTGTGDEAAKAGKFVKALLRNAPDVILVGETRDSGVAKTLMDAANTGHLAFTTLHTNSASTAVTRLTDLDVKPDALAASLICILAQRLVRLLCPYCKVPDTSDETRHALNVPYLTGAGTLNPFKEGPGCAACDHSGYKGRRMIYEILYVTDEVREMIENRHSPLELARKGIPKGKSMWACGLKLVVAGLTSVEEVKKRANPDS